MFLKLFGCNTVVLLHNILEQVDLESAGFTKNKLSSKQLDWYQSQQNAYFKDDVAVTIKIC
jgi:hypothetical protein